MRPTALLILLIVASGAAHAQVTRYVTDSLRLEVRSGPGVKNRIVRMVPSGTALKVIDESDGWSRVAIDGEAESWILSRYLTDEPSVRDQVDAAKALREGVEDRVRSIREQLSTATDTAQALELERAELSERARSLAAELEQIKHTASSAVDIQNENERLRRSSADNERGLQDLRQEYLLLKQSREMDWFIAGAAVLLGGIVLGLIIPKLRFRRRRGWGEL